MGLRKLIDRKLIFLYLSIMFLFINFNIIIVNIDNKIKLIILYDSNKPISVI